MTFFLNTFLKPHFLVCWWCDTVKKTSFFDEVKNRPKTAIFSPFSRTLKNDHFWPFFVCWRVLTISWRAANKFWWWGDVNGVLMTMSMMKKVVEDQKKLTKIDLSGTLYKKRSKWSPARAARNRGAEGSQGAFMTRSREVGLEGTFLKKNRMQTREWHVECERSDVRGVLWRMCNILKEWLTPHVGLMKAGACECSECVRVSQKSVRIFWYEVSWRHTG
jgi:hypothetical protein